MFWNICIPLMLLAQYKAFVFLMFFYDWMCCSYQKACMVQYCSHITNLQEEDGTTSRLIRQKENTRNHIFFSYVHCIEKNSEKYLAFITVLFVLWSSSRGKLLQVYEIFLIFLVIFLIFLRFFWFFFKVYVIFFTPRSS